jgi:hypothetical protein
MLCRPDSARELKSGLGDADDMKMMQSTVVGETRIQNRKGMTEGNDGLRPFLFLRHRIA